MTTDSTPHRPASEQELQALVAEADTGGRDPKGSGRDLCLDITRLREDTDYQPDYDIVRAVADYVSWLRAGHQR